uniref:Uncharacterized protein n=1 Tax=Oryza rufipogon TaxID=4529 RepID=A0A0E0Q127_ORYRU
YPVLPIFFSLHLVLPSWQRHQRSRRVPALVSPPSSLRRPSAPGRPRGGDARRSSSQGRSGDGQAERSRRRLVARSVLATALLGAECARWWLAARLLETAVVGAERRTAGTATTALRRGLAPPAALRPDATTGAGRLLPDGALRRCSLTALPPRRASSASPHQLRLTLAHRATARAPLQCFASVERGDGYLPSALAATQYAYRICLSRWRLFFYPKSLCTTDK